MNKCVIDDKTILMEEVKSSNIDSIGFDEPNGLIIAYKSGSVYKFMDVPKTIYENFLKAESKGKYMNEVIKPQYNNYKRII